VRKLAYSLAKNLGVRVEKCFVNTGILAQKTLNKKERLENARQSYVLRSDADVKGKKYLLVDDIITTGATMLASGELLLNAGALSVIPISYAKNIK
jgi:competence protein ComFC